MDKELIEVLEGVVKDLSKELEQKQSWGHLGNSLNRDAFGRLLIFEAEILMAIAYNA